MRLVKGIEALTRMESKLIPTWQTADGAVQLYLGDCLDIQIELSERAVVSDPPYGVSNNCDYTRFSGGLSPSHNYHRGIIGDSEPFNPRPWLSAKEVILWGFPYFAAYLEIGTTLVWNKKAANQLGTFLSDCELAWMKGGVGVYLFNHVWNGFDRQTERGEEVYHPSQKPVALMDWCISKVKSETIVDPYMGSGTTIVAGFRAGRRVIGIEKEPKYFDIAVKRIEAELNRAPLFEEPPQVQRQLI
jgi:site-specific DNA-methyltransferase (adenine-specific)